MIRLLVLCVAICCLSGCMLNMSSGACHGKSVPQLLDATSLKPLFQELAYELCSSGGTDCGSRNEGASRAVPVSCGLDEQKRQTVLVTDFVDIKSYMPEQSGLILGEMMRGALNQVCCYKIVQAEFGKYFKLNENGLISLTRKISEVKQDDYQQPEVIVGTYAYLNSNKVVLFVRRINTSTGHVLKMATRELDYSCSGSHIRYGVK